MCVTTSQHEISGKNSHLLSQKVFLRSIIYQSEKKNHWNKHHFGMRYRPHPLTFMPRRSNLTDYSKITNNRTHIYSHREDSNSTCVHQ